MKEDRRADRTRLVRIASQPERGRLVRARVLNGINNDGIERRAGRLELEAELLLDGNEDTEIAGLRVPYDAEFRRSFDTEFVSARETGAVDDGTF